MSVTTATQICECCGHYVGHHTRHLMVTINGACLVDMQVCARCQIGATDELMRDLRRSAGGPITFRNHRAE